MQSLTNLLSEKGFSLVKAAATKGYERGWFGGSVSHEEIMMFTVQLQTILSASIPLFKAVSIMAGQTVNRFFKHTLEEIGKDIQSGQSFSVALRKHPKIFNNIFCNMIEVGEVRGNLEQVLVKLAVIIEAENRLRANALMMLVIQMVLAVGGVLLLLFKIFPNFSQTIWIYDTLREQYFLVIGAMLGTIGIIWVLARIKFEKTMTVTMNDPEVLAALKEVSAIKDREALIALKKAPEETPIVKLVNLVLSQAVQKGASAIHIEPDEGELRVRYRCGGTLVVAMNLQPEAQKSVVSRLKLMGGMDTSECRIPQDGRINLTIMDKSIEFRVNIIPVAFGEKVCMHILEKSDIKIKLENIGLTPENFKILKKAIVEPNGIILITGPPRSGKTTTLYACLNAIKGEDMNIYTVENPVDYKLKMVNQVPVGPSWSEISLDFGTVLQAIFRQDPDVIMFGEITNIETASIAVEAALMGHLVFSTLYANRAPSAANRLTNLGVDPSLISATLRCIVSQRLARGVCKFCKDIDRTITPEVLKNLGLPLEAINGTYFRGMGCDNCFQSGYKGPLGVHEVMCFSEKIRELLHQKASDEVLMHAAIENGMKTLREDLTLKFTQGLTTPNEVLALVRAD